jgi:hypothetical protein
LNSCNLIDKQFFNRPRTETTTFHELRGHLFDEMKKSSSKSAVLLTELDYKVLKAIFDDVPELMEENYDNLEVTLAFCTYHNAYNSRLVKKVGEYLVEGGILQHINDYFLNFELMPRVTEASGPNVFSLDFLSFGFYIWLIACGISTFFFVVEVLWFYISIRVKNILRNLLALMFLLRFLRRHQPIL